MAPESLTVSKADFEAALTRIQPSAIREVLVTVPDLTWESIGGLEQVKSELRQIVSLSLTRRDQFKAMRLKATSGILLYGPPGCGKTLLAKAAAHEAGVNFIAVEGPEIFTKWLGESEEMIRRIFRVGRQLAPTIIFFDQLDAIAPHRGSDVSTKTTERVVNQLLAEMDGIEALGDVIVIGASNRVELIDESVLRAGRFGTHLYVPLPDQKGREAITRLQFTGVPLAKPKDLERIIAAVTDFADGFSGAQITAICEKAKLLAIESSEADSPAHLEFAHVQKILDEAKSGAGAKAAFKV